MSLKENVRKLEKTVKELEKIVKKPVQKSYGGPKRWDATSDEMEKESKRTGRPIYYVQGLPRIG